MGVRQYVIAALFRITGLKEDNKIDESIMNDVCEWMAGSNWKASKAIIKFPWPEHLHVYDKTLYRGEGFPPTLFLDNNFLNEGSLRVNDAISWSTEKDSALPFSNTVDSWGILFHYKAKKGDFALSLNKIFESPRIQEMDLPPLCESEQNEVLLDHSPEIPFSDIDLVLFDKPAAYNNFKVKEIIPFKEAIEIIKSKPKPPNTDDDNKLMNHWFDLES